VNASISNHSNLSAFGTMWVCVCIGYHYRSSVHCFCSLLYQVQQVLGHLMESKLQFYTPERFWQVFRLWADAPVNIREQQDALDFFQAFIDQIDEQIKVSYQLIF
jgi:hypothetical protein